MEKNDPMRALESFYRAADEAHVPAGLHHCRPPVAKGKPGTELLKIASACAAGIAVACLLALPGTPEGRAIPATTDTANALREQMVRSGLDPDDFPGVNERRSQLGGGTKWRV